MATYIPRVLVCGDIEEFRRKIGDKTVEVIRGGINVDYNQTDGIKLFMGEQELTYEQIYKLLEGTADYLIFVDAMDHCLYLEKFQPHPQIMLVDAFIRKIHDCFFTYKLLEILRQLINQEKFQGRVLDFDCYLAKSDFHTRRGWQTELDCIAENFCGTLYPIMKNVYGNIYRNFDECKFRKFDAILLTKERTPAEFIDALIETDSLAENIFTFVRKNTALESWLVANENIFAVKKFCKTETGCWWILKKIMPPVDVGVYVVTHKQVELGDLPEGYRIIHAGKALGKNFGYAGDDTGENISRLNPLLNEATALYWIWKNTRHTHCGFVHYRRFFTSDEEQNFFDINKILSAKDILKILSEYDIIVPHENLSERTHREFRIRSTRLPKLIEITDEIVLKHMKISQPDYLDAFDSVWNGFVMFHYEMFLARRNVFNAYCEWLFSFMLPATEEMLDKLRFGDKQLNELPHHLSRLPGFYVERMLTVWLMKNHLRIKSLPIMFHSDLR